jgi:hypothetical protein
MSKDRCLRCGNSMTWVAQRVQYGRFLRRGFTTETARAVLPRCQKCVTLHLRSIAAGAPCSESSECTGPDTYQFQFSTESDSRSLTRARIEELKPLHSLHSVHGPDSGRGGIEA